MSRGIQLTKNMGKNASECLAVYIKHCRIKNLAQRTIKLYKAECECFIEWYGETRGISEIDKEIIGDYIIHIKDTGISQAYVATKMRQLRAFLYFCMEREYLRRFKITIPKFCKALYCCRR